MSEKSGYPDDNPKTVLGVKKVPVNLVPPSAKHFLAEAFADGAGKYGPYNWRDKTVSASIYYAAAQRHMDAWWDGEDLSHDAKVHHLAHAMACMAIVLDAMTVGRLNDDRPPIGAASRLQQGYAENKNNNTEGKIEQSSKESSDNTTTERAQYPVEPGGVSDLQAHVRASILKFNPYTGLYEEY